MGGRITTLPAVSAHDYLKKYVGKEYIPSSDPFWKEFLSFPGLCESEYNALENIEEMDSSVLHEFRKHNLKSRQLSSLMQFIISHGTELLGSVIQPEANYDKSLLSIVQNALLVFRISAKYLVERTSEHRFVMHLKGDSDEDSNLSLLECFFQVLFRLLLEVPVKDETYGLHCETLMTILVLLARQMHNDLSCPLPRVYVYLMWGKAASLAPAIVHRLITNFADNIPVPPGLHNRSSQSSFIWRAASSLAGGIWTVVTLGYGGRGQTQANSTSKAAFSTTPISLTNSVADPAKLASDTVVTDLVTSESMVLSGLPQDCHLLADLSALLLLVLTTQAGSILRCTRILQELGITSQTPSLNPYRVALFSLRDINDHEVSASPKPVRASGSDRPPADPKPRLSNANLKGVTSLINPDVTEFPVDFVAIRDTAAHTLHQDSSTLLLYLLIHRNPHFQTFLLAKRNYDKLLLPLLNILYRSPADSSHLVYMALIIILILTENERFGEEIHTSLIHWVKWSSNRQLSSISRGSLVILVLIRTIRYHLNQLKDRYLHVNILAALANLSAKVTNMHPYVSDAFLCLLQLLAKRYNRTVEQLRQLSVTCDSQSETPVGDGTERKTGNDVSGPSDAADSPPNEKSMVQELALLEELICVILEILNSILTHVLPHNSNLIYSLLYKRDCLDTLRSHPSFQSVIQNLDAVISSFSKKIEQELGENPTSATALLSLINKHSPNIQRHCHLKKFPELRFKYVEEESPDDFFIPYVWSIVIRQSGIPFRTDSLRLFASDSGNTTAQDLPPSNSDADQSDNETSIPVPSEPTSV